ncbi:MAG: dockerin type I domain-containing protein [Ruminococcus sp.]|nr:dockerin type I domain-containing protein [Ruminococcus sp.]
MKSFKKILAGVCSLVMLSSIATYAVSAELGDSIGTSLGASDVTPGTSGDLTPGDSGDTTLGNCSGVSYLKGDVNGDGKVKSNDLLLLKKYLLGLVDEADINMANADVVVDGKLKSSDLLLLKKVLLGLTDFD